MTAVMMAMLNAYYAEPWEPIEHLYTSGSGTETVPDGASHVIIEIVGGGMGGYVGDMNFGGGGGNGAGYAKSAYSCTPGQTLSYSVGAAGSGGRPGGGAGGDSTVTSGTMSITAMTGAKGNSSGPGAGTGGNVTNTSGSSGESASDYMGGAGGMSAWPYDSSGYGGDGGGAKDVRPYGWPGYTGNAGAVRFYYDDGIGGG